MKTIRVDLGPRSYDVLIGSGALVRAGSVLASHQRVAVVTQAGIRTHWGERVSASLDEAGVRSEVFEVGDGEAAKSLETVDSLCRAFARWGLLRGDAVVALGGGVVGDTAGLAAALYHRGVDVLQAPTSLLAQVDSATGGKTGVNLPEGKNLVGAFHQPLAVLADIDALASLPERDFRSGLGEVLKYACGLDERLKELVGTRAQALFDRDAGVLAELVERCVQIKADVVSADEHELTGLRSRLNYGHTLAHALESLGGYGLSHGEAVAIGVTFAAELARELGRVDDEVVAEHHRLVDALELPRVVPSSVRRDVDAARVIEQMRRDKKARGGLTFVLLGSSGLDRVEDPAEASILSALAAVGIEP